VCVCVCVCVRVRARMRACIHTDRVVHPASCLVRACGLSQEVQRLECEAYNRSPSSIGFNNEWDSSTPYIYTLHGVQLKMGKLPKLKSIFPDRFFVIIFTLLPAYSLNAHADRSPQKQTKSYFSHQDLWLS
jgi:hypothetical protein